MEYGFKRRVALPFAETVEKTKAELAKEGFGVIAEIDVKATFKKKLNVEFDNYLILGACNPTFAYQALLSEKEIGLLLPCNVLVYEEGGSVFVSAILPTVAMSVASSVSLTQLATEVEEKLQRAISAVAPNAI